LSEEASAARKATAPQRLPVRRTEQESETRIDHREPAAEEFGDQGRRRRQPRQAENDQMLLGDAHRLARLGIGDAAQGGSGRHGGILLDTDEKGPTAKMRRFAFMAR
jgi:hypothetical protein